MVFKLSEKLNHEPFRMKPFLALDELPLVLIEIPGFRKQGDLEPSLIHRLNPFGIQFLKDLAHRGMGSILESLLTDRKGLADLSEIALECHGFLFSLKARTDDASYCLVTSRAWKERRFDGADQPVKAVKNGVEGLSKFLQKLFRGKVRS